MSFEIISHEDVFSALMADSIVLIDVRTALERLKPGRIPGSKHVPLVDFERAFSSHDPRWFKGEFDFEMPRKGEEGESKRLAVCGEGREQAAEAAKRLRDYGWIQTSVFPLSLDEWRSGGGPVLSGEGRRVDFDWVREALESGRTDTIVVDVRRDQERTDPGYIPGAKHVPLHEISKAFSPSRTSASSFLGRYEFGRPRPGEEGRFVRLVTHCKAGIRARMAADVLALLGYQDVAVYHGSMSDWIARGGEVKRESGGGRRD